jgi:hypothetical protein
MQPPGLPIQNALIGGRDLGTEAQSGGRIAAGWWLTDNHLWGIEADGFFVANNSNSSVSSNGNPALGRPIIDQTPFDFLRNGAGFVILPPTLIARALGQPNAELVAFMPANGQGGEAGSVSVVRHSSLWGADLNLRRNVLCCGESGYLDMYVGYRMLGLEESLSITESLLVVGPQLGAMPGGALVTAMPLIPNGTTFVINDRFSTSNRFYGAQVGFKGEWRFGCWSLDSNLGVALGTTQQFVDISGSTVATTPGTPPVATTGVGGLLALQGTNIGHYSRSRFTVVPELGLNLGYQFCPHLRGFVGYNFLYWSDVVRPGQQIDLNVNRTFQPGSPIARSGPAVPAFAVTGTDFWAQGITVGLELRY